MLTTLMRLSDRFFYRLNRWFMSSDGSCVPSICESPVSCEIEPLPFLVRGTVEGVMVASPAQCFERYWRSKVSRV